MNDLETYESEAYLAAMELISVAKPKKGSVLVVGCSTSEVLGSRPGTNSAPSVGEAICSGIMRACNKAEIFLAAQCCEHLNRAIIVEEELANKLNLERVNAKPMPKAGGSFPTALWKTLKSPCTVEKIKADLGLDIGLVLIGMCLKEVAVPLRLTNCKIGSAPIVAARTRPKFIGGERACYEEELK